MSLRAGMIGSPGFTSNPRVSVVVPPVATCSAGALEARIAQGGEVVGALLVEGFDGLSFSLSARSDHGLEQLAIPGLLDLELGEFRRGYTEHTFCLSSGFAHNRE